MHHSPDEATVADRRSSLNEARMLRGAHIRIAVELLEETDSRAPRRTRMYRIVGGKTSVGIVDSQLDRRWWS